MHDLAENTLKFYEQDPLLQKNFLYNIPSQILAEEMKRFGYGKAVPETDALTFYFCNHVMHLIGKKYDKMEILPPAISAFLKFQSKQVAQICTRTFYHLLMVSLDDARFIMPGSQKLSDLVEQRFGKDMASYIQGSMGSRSQQGGGFAHPKISTGMFAHGLYYVFTFGGCGWAKPWSKISQSLLDVIQGHHNIEMFTDQVFSLIHNGGSVFNKGRYYQVNSDMLFNILDIQDSGQVPQWLGQNQKSQYAPQELVKVYTALAQYFPEIKDPLNAARVRSSTHKREKDIQKQKAGWQVFAQAQGAGGPAAAQDKAPPVNALDSLLIDDFKRKKWL